MDTPNNPPAHTKGRTSETSYKFQRLREKLRAAIASGELSGKLPGERALAKRFHVNAKTLSKADGPAAEGVLDRSIGRGTYVKGSAPTPGATKPWLLLCDEGDPDAQILLEHLRKANPETQSTCNGARCGRASSTRSTPSSTPPRRRRNRSCDLVVRNLTVVAVGREARMYSMHAVLVDAARAARFGDLILAGHRRFASVETNGTHLQSFWQ